MKTYITLFLILLSVSACNKTRESTQDGLNAGLEKLFESKTGQELDLADVGSFENNAVKASFLIDGQEKITSKSKMTGMVLGSKEENERTLSFQFQDEEGTMIMVVISGFPDNFSLPFTTKFYVQNKIPEDTHSAIVTFIKASESGMFSYMSFDGTLNLNELNTKTARLAINGKVGDGMDLDKPQNWKDMKANFTITSPIIQTMGFDKNEILK